MRVIVLEKGELFSLVKRNTEFNPWVVCFDFDIVTGSWVNGHYFNDLKEAVDFLYENDPKFCKENEE